jgi:ABC-type multidrug transport system permease subunit
LKHQGVATVPALSAGAIFPIISTVFSWAKSRRVDLIGVISLAFIVVSVAASLISGSTRFTLLKESVFTGVFGAILLVSLLFPQPIMFYFSRQFAAGGDPARIAHWNDLWQHASFRRSQRVITAVWGCGWVLDALIRVALVFILSTSLFLVVSQVLFFGIFIGIFYWMMAYVRRVRKQGEEARAATKATA